MEFFASGASSSRGRGDCGFNSPGETAARCASAGAQAVYGGVDHQVGRLHSDRGIVAPARRGTIGMIVAGEASALFGECRLGVIQGDCQFLGDLCFGEAKEMGVGLLLRRSLAGRGGEILAVAGVGGGRSAMLFVVLLSGVRTGSVMFAVIRVVIPAVMAAIIGKDQRLGPCARIPRFVGGALGIGCGFEIGAGAFGSVPGVAVCSGISATKPEARPLMRNASGRGSPPSPSFSSSLSRVSTD